MNASKSEAPQVDASPNERTALLNVERGTGWRYWATHISQLLVVASLVFGSVMYSIAAGQESLRPADENSEMAVASPPMLPGMIIHAPEMDEEVFRISRFLRKHTRDSVKAVRIADALVEQGRRRKIDPTLILGVLMNEAPKLDTMSQSFMGARGLMQVMPFHSGKYGCKSANLYSIESNICHGAGVLAGAIKSTKSVRTALLRYNGCVNSTNTANCHAYPDKVLKVANKATAQMLAMVPSVPPSIITPLTLEDLERPIQD